VESRWIDSGGWQLLIARCGKRRLTTPKGRYPITNKGPQGFPLTPIFRLIIEPDSGDADNLRQDLLPAQRFRYIAIRARNNQRPVSPRGMLVGRFLTLRWVSTGHEQKVKPHHSFIVKSK